MSYDLYFYKKRGASLTESDISEYLNENLVSTSESYKQWFVEDEDTEVYFSFDLNEPNTETEDVAFFDSFQDFSNTNFTFNLNYFRPDFFGKLSFEFVERFVKELDLFVLNPQSTEDDEHPVKPRENELYENWSAINARNSLDYFEEYDLEYYPLEKSNDFYDYNYNRVRLQEQLGEAYYVPKLYILKTKSDGKIVTVSFWSEHLPVVFPPAEYFLITKKYRRLFRKVEESGLISAATFYQRFGSFISDFNFKGCKIIHPDQAERAMDVFNSTKIEIPTDAVERVQIDRLVNIKPGL
ncbi:hypothetical protein [Desertivirga brevis]|uniref:hypothetical protein n=1 Tax=Desertivirga brevis TaxID=2810310 RepID=UPI001A97443B|nr:hypothetical protein [Pedobacter sp. SYSU D00873]